MHKRKWIERFSADIDDLLKHGDVTQLDEPVSDEYAEMLSLAEKLSSADFSPESQVRRTLRRRLLNPSSPRNRWQLTERLSMVTLFQKRFVTAALPAAVLVALLVTTLIWPSAVAAAVENVVAFTQRLWVGEHTTVAPIDPESITITEDGRLTMPGQLAEEPGNEGLATFEGPGSFEMEIRSFNSIAAAQAAAPFSLRLPAALPQGYAFSEASVWGRVHVNLHYAGPGGDLLFIQRPVGDQPGQTVSIGLPDDYVVETTQVNNRDATWAQHVLLWEADGYSYLLSSPELSQLDAVRFAESLE